MNNENKDVLKIIERKNSILIPTAAISDMENKESIKSLAAIYALQGIKAFSPLDLKNSPSFEWICFSDLEQEDLGEVNWKTYRNLGGAFYNNNYYLGFSYETMDNKIDEDSFIDPELEEIDGIEYYVFNLFYC